MQRQRRCGASCAATLGLVFALARCGAASATEPRATSIEVAADSISESISEVMLEDTGLELEDTAPPQAAGDELAETDAAEAPESEAPPPVPARAAPSP
jgi:hypothetical protein